MLQTVAVRPSPRPRARMEIAARPGCLMTCRKPYLMSWSRTSMPCLGAGGHLGLRAAARRGFAAAVLAATLRCAHLGSLVPGRTVPMPAAPTSAEVEAALGYEACVFRHFFEEASVGMALAGPDRRFVKVNRSFCQMLC